MASQPPRMSAGDPTIQLAAPETGAKRRSRPGFHLWPRTLRWRLILSYALLLLVTLAGLGFALNAFISRTLYTSEFTFFQSEAVASVGDSQARFDTLTLGQGPGCAGALPYEQAFQQAIAQPIVASHPGAIHGVFLLDGDGSVLAPLSAQSASGAAPYLQMARLRALEVKATRLFNRGADASGSRQLADAGYVVMNGSAPAPYGVELIALRYYPGSRCDATPTAALGYVEIVTTFSRTRLTLASLRLVILLVIAAIFALGLLLGGPLISAALSPLSRLNQAARRVASGDLSHRARL